MARVPLTETGRLAIGWPEPSTTRPETPVIPPGVGPVTVTVIVSDTVRMPSPARMVSGSEFTWVASGVKRKTPVWLLNVAWAGNGSGVAANETGSLSGSVAMAVKVRVLPSGIVLFPIGASTGAPFTMVRERLFEAPPPGVGFSSVTDTVPWAVSSAAGITAVSDVALTNVVTRAVAPNCTVAPVTNFWPVSVSVVVGLPLGRLAGERVVSEGTGFTTVTVLLALAPFSEAVMSA